MSTMILIAVICVSIAVAAIVIACVVFYLRQRAQQFSQQVFGTPDLAEGFAKQQYEYENMPKSLSSATSIYLPRIKADFPQFNYDDMRVRCENVVASYFSAIDRMDANFLSEGSPELREALRLRIGALRDAGQREQYDKIKTHGVAITRYDKRHGRCTITFQCAFQSKHALLDTEGNVLKGSADVLKQERCNVELVYIQDVDRAKDTDRELGLSCPNCGAPVKELGQKTCSYCGTGIVEINIHAWQFHSIKEG